MPHTSGICGATPMGSLAAQLYNYVVEVWRGVVW